MFETLLGLAILIISGIMFSIVLKDMTSKEEQKD